MSRCVAVLLAAGQGKRMNSQVHKQYLLLQDKPVLYYSLRAFEDCARIDEVILVTGAEEVSYCRQQIVEKYEFHKVTQIVTGGKERYHSVYQGLKAISSCDYVFIHDGARPFVNEDMIQKCYRAVQADRACVVGVHAKDTIKLENGAGMVETTPNRSRVWMVQTPQVFSFSLIKSAYERLMEEERQLLEQGVAITDDTMVVETFSDCPVRLVEGDYRNIKITTPEDMQVAEIFLKSIK